MPDILLQFGVEGGGSLGTGSGAQISRDIKDIVKQIEKTVTNKLSFNIDPKSAEKIQEQIQSQLDKTTFDTTKLRESLQTAISKIDVGQLTIPVGFTPSSSQANSAVNTGATTGQSATSGSTISRISSDTERLVQNVASSVFRQSTDAAVRAVETALSSVKNASGKIRELSNFVAYDSNNSRVQSVTSTQNVLTGTVATHNVRYTESGAKKFETFAYSTQRITTALNSAEDKLRIFDRQWEELVQDINKAGLSVEQFGGKSRIASQQIPALTNAVKNGDYSDIDKSLNVNDVQSAVTVINQSLNDYQKEINETRSYLEKLQAAQKNFAAVRSYKDSFADKDKYLTYTDTFVENTAKTESDINSIFSALKSGDYSKVSALGINDTASALEKVNTLIKEYRTNIESVVQGADKATAAENRYNRALEETKALMSSNLYSRYDSRMSSLSGQEKDIASLTYAIQTNDYSAVSGFGVTDFESAIAKRSDMMLTYEKSVKRVKSEIDKVAQAEQKYKDLLTSYKSVINDDSKGILGDSFDAQTKSATEAMCNYEAIINALKSGDFSKVNTLGVNDIASGFNKATQYASILRNEIKNVQTRVREVVKEQKDSQTFEEKANRAIIAGNDLLRRRKELLKEAATQGVNVNTAQYNADATNYQYLLRALSHSNTDKFISRASGITNIFSDMGVTDKTSALKKASEYAAKLNAELRAGQAALSGFAKQQNIITQQNKIYAEATRYYKEFQSGINTKIDIADQWQKFFTTIKSGTTPIETLRAELARLQTATKDAGAETRSLWGSLKKLFTDHFGSVAATAAIGLGRQVLRGMYDNVVEIDSAMTELKKVTDLTEQAYDSFQQRAAKTAKEVSGSVADTINATADFARLGYGLGDAEQLAKAALIYKNVGDGISDISEASESIISTLQAFKDITASDAMTIIDKFNEVGNNFAISSSGIGEALRRSAASLSLGGASLDESIALITAGNTVIQDPDTVGTALKTISMYLRAAKTDAEEAGISTDGMAVSVSKLRNELKMLTGVDIMKDSETFKGVYEIMDELAKVWDKLSDVSKSNVLSLIGGKRNGNINAAILENFDVARKALSTSENDSEGSALREQAKFADSIKGKLNDLKVAYEDLSQTVMSDELIKNVVGILADIVQGISDITKNVGVLTPIIGALMAKILVKDNWGIGTVIDEGKVKFSLFGQTFEDVGKKFDTFRDKSKKGIKGFFDSIKSGGQAVGQSFMDRVYSALGIYSSADMSKDIEEITKIKEGIEGILKTDGLNKTGIQNKIVELTGGTNQLAGANEVTKDWVNNLADAALSCNDAEKANEALTKSMEKFTEQAGYAVGGIKDYNGAWSNLRGTLISMAVQAAIMLIGAGIQQAEQIKQKLEEDKQAARDATDTFKEQSKAMEDLVAQYTKIRDSESTEADKKVELASLIQDLSDKYSIELQQLKDLNLERQEGIDLIRAEAEEKRKRAASDWDKDNGFLQWENGTPKFTKDTVLGNTYNKRDSAEKIWANVAQYLATNEDGERIADEEEWQHLLTDAGIKYATSPITIDGASLVTTNRVDIEFNTKNVEEQLRSLNTLIDNLSDKAENKDVGLTEVDEMIQSWAIERRKELNSIVSDYSSNWDRFIEDQAYVAFNAFNETFGASDGDTKSFEAFDKAGRTAYAAYRDGLLDEAEKSMSSDVAQKLPDILAEKFSGQEADYLNMQKATAYFGNPNNAFEAQIKSRSNAFLESLSDTELEAFVTKVVPNIKSGITDFVELRRQITIALAEAGTASIEGNRESFNESLKNITEMHDKLATAYQTLSVNPQGLDSKSVNSIIQEYKDLGFTFNEVTGEAELSAEAIDEYFNKFKQAQLKPIEEQLENVNKQIGNYRNNLKNGVPMDESDRATYEKNLATKKELESQKKLIQNYTLAKSAIDKYRDTITYATTATQNFTKISSMGSMLKGWENTGTWKSKFQSAVTEMVSAFPDSKELADAANAYLENSTKENAESILKICQKLYADDITAYSNYLRTKFSQSSSSSEDDAGAWSRFKKDAQTYFDSLKTMYGIDLANTKTWADAKKEIIESIGINGDYFDYLPTSARTGIKNANADTFSLLDVIEALFKSFYEYETPDTADSEWKSLFEKENKEKQHQLAMSQITEKQYIDWLDGAYKAYFSDKTKYLDEYNQYEEQVFTYRHKSEFEELNKQKEHERSLNKITDEEYYDWLEDTYKEYFGGLTAFEDEFYKYQEECYKHDNEVFKNSLEERQTLLEDFYGKAKGSDIDEQYLKDYAARVGNKYKIDGSAIAGLNKDDWNTLTAGDSDGYSSAVNKLIASVKEKDRESFVQDLTMLGRAMAVIDSPDPADGNLITAEVAKAAAEAIRDSQQAYANSLVGRIANGETGLEDELTSAYKDLSSDQDRVAEAIDNYVDKALQDWDDKKKYDHGNNSDDVDLRNERSKFWTKLAEENYGKDSGNYDPIQYNSIMKEIEEYDEETAKKRREQTINYIEEWKQVREQYWDDEIAKIEDEEDKLSKINEIEQKRIDLIKARIALEDARKNKNQLIFSNGSYHYDVDQDAVLKADDDYVKAGKSLNTALTNQQKEELKEAKTAESKVFENMVKDLKKPDDTTIRRFYADAVDHPELLKKLVDAGVMAPDQHGANYGETGLNYGKPEAIVEAMVEFVRDELKKAGKSYTSGEAESVVQTAMLTDSSVTDVLKALGITVEKLVDTEAKTAKDKETKTADISKIFSEFSDEILTRLTSGTYTVKDIETMSNALMQQAMDKANALPSYVTSPQTVSSMADIQKAAELTIEHGTVSYDNSVHVGNISMTIQGGTSEDMLNQFANRLTSAIATTVTKTK